MATTGGQARPTISAASEARSMTPTEYPGGKLMIAGGLLLAMLSGCAKRKAAWMPNDHGGFTLMTEADSMEEAVERFRRTADDVCQERRYTMTPPVVTDRGWR